MQYRCRMLGITRFAVIFCYSISYSLSQFLSNVFRLPPFQFAHVACRNFGKPFIVGNHRDTQLSLSLQTRQDKIRLKVRRICVLVIHIINRKHNRNWRTALYSHGFFDSLVRYNCGYKPYTTQSQQYLYNTRYYILGVRVIHSFWPLNLAS